MDSFVFTRHSSDCKFKRDRFCNRCNCPKWVEGRFIDDKGAYQFMGIEFFAAATDLRRHLPTQKNKAGSLLPPLAEARALGRLIGEAVGRQAILGGEAQVASADELMHGIEANIWEPVCELYVRAS